MPEWPLFSRTDPCDSPTLFNGEPVGLTVLSAHDHQVSLGGGVIASDDEVRELLGHILRVELEPEEHMGLHERLVARTLRQDPGHEPIPASLLHEERIFSIELGPAVQIGMTRLASPAGTPEHGGGDGLQGLEVSARVGELPQHGVGLELHGVPLGVPGQLALRVEGPRLSLAPFAGDPDGELVSGLLEAVEPSLRPAAILRLDGQALEPGGPIAGHCQSEDQLQQGTNQAGQRLPVG